jgi:general secretion pathway protein A
MYQDFYGLREMPFNITPDPRFLFLSETHQEALEHLRYGIRERKGFMLLTGEVGCGKTTLCRKLMAELEPERYATALILNPRLSETQLLRAILQELGETHFGISRADMLDQLNKLLLRLIDDGKDIVLIIDESQNLEFETIEHLRMLSNLETDTRKLLQIILIGQPELKAKLLRHNLRQLRQRLLVHGELRPLRREEVFAYIQHRLSTAGGSGRPRFTTRACRLIHRQSKGTPRLINNLCDHALLAAFVKNSDTVGYWEVRRAIRETTLS